MYPVPVPVQSPSCVWLFVTPRTAAHQATLSLTISRSLPKFISIALVMPFSHLILRCPLLLPSIFPNIRDFTIELAVRIKWPNYWSFSSSSSNEYSGLISLKIDWFHLLAVQGIFRGPLQHHSSKASILWCSAFFTVQLSQLYITTRKIIALMWTFVGRVMSLLFSTLSLSSFSCQEQSSSDFMAAVTTCSNFGAQEEEIFLYFHFFPFYLPCSNGAGCHDLSFF